MGSEVGGEGGSMQEGTQARRCLRHCTWFQGTTTGPLRQTQQGSAGRWMGDEAGGGSRIRGRYQGPSAAHLGGAAAQETAVTRQASQSPLGHGRLRHSRRLGRTSGHAR